MSTHLFQLLFAPTILESLIRRRQFRPFKALQGTHILFEKPTSFKPTTLDSI